MLLVPIIISLDAASNSFNYAKDDRPWKYLKTLTLNVGISDRDIFAGPRAPHSAEADKPPLVSKSGAG
jgi:hypothetical protein